MKQNENPQNDQSEPKVTRDMLAYLLQCSEISADLMDGVIAVSHGKIVCALISIYEEPDGRMYIDCGEDQVFEMTLVKSDLPTSIEIE